MKLSAQIAKNFHDVFFGGNWTVSNLKDNLADVTWQEATTPLHGLNTIAILTNHICYYIPIVTRVLEGGPLEGNDKLSFTHPPFQSQEEWDSYLAGKYAEIEALVKLIEQMPDDKILADFIDPKYGNYFRNLMGIVEHTHYHLGQIAIIKKMIRASAG